MPTRVPVAEFVKSAFDPADWPPAGSEIAFAGRSNVGKSSLMNTLLERRGLVKTSSTPGRTRLLNFFAVEVIPDGGARTALSLADLPGFGYAKVSKVERATWRPALESYLEGRMPLVAVALLIDARRGAEIDETELAPWIASQGVHVVPVLTKADKLPKHERRPAAERLHAAMQQRPVVFSALSGEGRDELWTRLLRAVAEGRRG